MLIVSCEDPQIVVWQTSYWLIDWMQYDVSLISYLFWLIDWVPNRKSSEILAYSIEVCVQVDCGGLQHFSNSNPDHTNTKTQKTFRNYLNKFKLKGNLKPFINYLKRLYYLKQKASAHRSNLNYFAVFGSVTLSKIFRFARSMVTTRIQSSVFSSGRQHF